MLELIIVVAVVGWVIVVWLLHTLCKMLRAFDLALRDNTTSASFQAGAAAYLAAQAAQRK